MLLFGDPVQCLPRITILELQPPWPHHRALLGPLGPESWKSPQKVPLRPGLLVGQEKAHKLWTHKLLSGQPWDNPPVNQREKFIFPVFRGEHINFLARLTLGQPAVCPRAIWTLTRAKRFMFMCLFLPEFEVSRRERTGRYTHPRSPPWQVPKGPKIKKINLAWNFQSWPPEFPNKNRCLVGGSLEVFNPACKFQDLEIFQSLGPWQVGWTLPLFFF